MNRILRTFLIATVVVVLAIAGLVILVQYPSYKRAKQVHELRSKQDRLSAALSAAFRDGDDIRVDLGKVISLPWDRVFVVAPYTPFETARRKMPGEWSTSDHDRIHERDDICILAFFDRSQLVARFSVPRRTADFASVVRDGGYGRKDTVFSIRSGRVLP